MEVCGQRDGYLLSFWCHADLNRLPHLLPAHTRIMKHLCGDPLAFAQDSHQQMTRADRAFPHALGFLAGHDEHPARAESGKRWVWIPLAAGKLTEGWTDLALRAGILH